MKTTKTNTSRFSRALALAATLSCLSGMSYALQAPPVPVRVDEVVTQELQQKRRVSGEVRATLISRVATREPGLVAKMLVREGQRVRTGQVLAKLDSTLLDADLAILKAQEVLAAAVISEREASVALAETDLAILQDMASRDAVNPKELGDAKTALLVVKARLEQARQEVAVLQARVALLAQRIRDMSPTAPFAGFVKLRHTQAGEWVEAGGALVELVSDQELEAWLDVPQAYYAALVTSKDSLQLNLDAGAELECDDWRVVPSLNSAGRTFPLIVSLPADSQLAGGMSLTADIPTGQLSSQLTIARDAILRGETGFYVYVSKPGPVEGSFVAATAPVEVLFYSGDRAAVRSPRLMPGDQVVVEGNERLYPTAGIIPTQQDAR